jgi:hypothetical protein
VYFHHTRNDAVSSVVCAGWLHVMMIISTTRDFSYDVALTEECTRWLHGNVSTVENVCCVMVLYQVQGILVGYVMIIYRLRRMLVLRSAVSTAKDVSWLHNAAVSACGMGCSVVLL